MIPIPDKEFECATCHQAAHARFFRSTRSKGRTLCSECIECRKIRKIKKGIRDARQ